MNQIEIDVDGRRLILGEPEGQMPIQLVHASFDGREYNIRYDAGKHWFIDDLFGLDYQNISGIDTRRTRTEITEEYARNF